MGVFKRNDLFPIIIILLLVIGCFSLYQSNHGLSVVLNSTTEAMVSAQNQTKSLEIEKQKLNEDNQALKEQLNEAQNQLVEIQASPKTLADSFEQSQIEKEGISPENITNDLFNHPELIPYEGVLGGTMMFTSVNVINQHYVFARFEDGHIMGAGLFEFQINADQSINWHHVTSNLY